MAGRGRGGAGRGRGRGSVSFNVEQLGLTSGEALPGPVLQPPPLYPPMERSPVPLQSGSEVEYLLALKREYMGFLKYSPMYIVRDTDAKDIERYSDYKNLDGSNKSNSLTYDWKRFPEELRPQSNIRKKKKTIQTNSTPAKKVKVEDLSKKFDQLEQIEKQNDVEEEEEENKNEDKEEGEAQDGDMEEEEDLDEEMDDGTDYVNNYFDNGESYLDEDDDNLDDGPVY